VALEPHDALRHLYVVGPTAVGKSTLLLQCIVRDLESGHGVVVMDRKGDLAADVLMRLPPERQGDVAVLDPADAACPVGLMLRTNATSTSSSTRWRVLCDDSSTPRLGTATRRHPPRLARDTRALAGDDAL
jgi:hypothetical protein